MGLLFRFLQALRDGKHISPSRLADLLSWKHSGFNIHDGGEIPVPAHDTEGRKRFAEYPPKTLVVETYPMDFLYTKPEKVHQLLLDQLGFTLPEQPPPEIQNPNLVVETF